MGMRFSRAFVAAAMLAAGAVVYVAPSATAATNTVVSLTFDDGQASHAAAAAVVQAHGMRGTFYINSGMVGSSAYYMTWPQIDTIAAAGNEIGGHTLTHRNLTTVNRSTAQREVCDDRQNLLGRGYSPVASFAYPEAAFNTTAKQVVQGCGYSSARAVGGVISGDICDDCPYAEAVPPQDAFALSTPEAADSNTSLALLQSYVTQAETHGGGWVVLTFHGVCNNSCTDGNSFSATLFGQFLDWLQPRQANGTVVRTVGEVMGATAPQPGPPNTSITCYGGTCSTGWYRTSPVNVGLVALDPNGSAIASTRYTTDGSDPVSSGIAYSGPFPVAATTTVRYYSTDVDGHAEPVRSTQIRVDATAPAVQQTSPATGASYRRGSSIQLTAAATDAASGIAKVVFRDGSATLRTDNSAPYTWSWRTPNNLSLGSHSLTAVATDVAGNTKTSAPVVITITR